MIELCAFVLPNGHRCGGSPKRGYEYCRFHQLTLTRQAIDHNRPEVFNLLGDRPRNIRRNVRNLTRAYREGRFTLREFKLRLRSVALMNQTLPKPLNLKKQYAVFRGIYPPQLKSLGPFSTFHSRSN